MAVTDHDTTDGLQEALLASRKFPHLTLIPGIELSTDMPGNEIHILGLFIDYSNRQFQRILSRFRAGRLERGKRMVEKLADLGINIEWSRVQEFAGHDAIGRPHLALAMVEKGYISQPKEAFDVYLKRNGSAYVEREKLDPRDSIELIKSVGGVAVLAHPADLDNLDQTLQELNQYGLVGLEVFYAQYKPETISELANTAARHSLVPCGGSDYHGLGNDDDHLPGENGPPIEVVEQLKDLLRINEAN